MMLFRQMTNHYYFFTQSQFKPSAFTIVFAVTFFGFLVSLHYTANLSTQREFRDFAKVEDTNRDSTIETPEPVTTTPTTSTIVPFDDCHCKSNETGEYYNFCYIDPQNETSIGKKFDCAHVKILEKFNILNNPGPSLSISAFIQNVDDIVFVSMTSDDHFVYSSNCYQSIRKFYPNHKYILYGLSLTLPYIHKLPKNDTNFEFRPFNASRYPKYVKNWLEYRFKPIIMAEAMLEFPNIWWIDDHVKAEKPDFIKKLFEKMASNRSTAGYSQITSFLKTIHSNFAVLLPELLQYFPSNSISLLKREFQVDAGLIHIPRTEKTIEIFKWWLLCALEEKCMKPAGSSLKCNFGENRMDYFANCFRFDQSVLNLLLLNEYQDHTKYYLGPLQEYFSRHY